MVIFKLSKTQFLQIFTELNRYGDSPQMGLPGYIYQIVENKRKRKEKQQKKAYLEFL